jgi:hypothetical protein
MFHPIMQLHPHLFVRYWHNGLVISQIKTAAHQAAVSV